MLASLVPGFVGLIVMGLLDRSPKYLWVKWGMFFMSATANIVGLMLWTFVPSNVAGRTKRTVTQS
jgi:ACS family allantoate permease-like MFS transporter